MLLRSQTFSPKRRGPVFPGLMGALSTPHRHLQQAPKALPNTLWSESIQVVLPDFTASPSRLSKSDFDLLVMCSTDIQKPEGLKSTITLFYYCSEGGISIVHQWLSKGSIPLCMFIATLLSIKNRAHRDTAREKGCTDFLTWFVSSSLNQMLVLEICKLIPPIGIQGLHFLVILHPVQISRPNFISQFGDHKFSLPASLHSWSPDFLPSWFKLQE